MPLIPGRYRLNIWSAINDFEVDWIKNTIMFDVESGDFYGSRLLPAPYQGMFLFNHQFIVGENHRAAGLANAPQRF